MKRAIYPGSFDPMTNGHLDILKRSATIFDEIIVGILVNLSKQCLFSVEERKQMMDDALRAANITNVVTCNFDGLLMDFAHAKSVNVIIRGLRSATDFDYEKKIETVNKEIAPDIETIFLIADKKYAHLSSSIVREVGHFGGNIAPMVPPVIVERVQKRVNEA